MQDLQEKTKEIMQQAIVADIALGFEPEIEVPHKWELLDRYHQSGFHYLGLAIAGEFTNLETTMHYLSRHRAIIQQHPQAILVENAQAILKAKQQNKLAIGLWLQGTTPLANDVHMVETYYRLGIRSILLTYNTRNALGDGLTEKHDGGLSRLGYNMVAEMNRVGMLIDLSHSGIRTSLDTIEASSDPVIFSHSNAHHLAPHVRNLTDEQIFAVAKKGGVIGINGASLLLGSKQSTSTAIVDHIDYITQLVGDNHLALGLDLIYFHDMLDLFYQRAGETFYPKNYVPNYVDSFQPEKIQELIETLLIRGFSDDQIKKILGGNFLRVIQQVWK